MHAISDTDALRLWETGWRLRPVERAQALLAVACPDADAGALAALPVGVRNARLLRARARSFGDTLPCEARCPACDERLEFALSIDALLEGGEHAAPTLAIVHEGVTYTARLPADADLLAVLAEGSGRQGLMARCVVAPPLETWPEAAVEQAETRMAEADPLSLIQMDLSCPACGHAWDEPLDAVEFFFAELADAARHALFDVHRLARAYGWRESDVLALSPWRRRQYLALVDG